MIRKYLLTFFICLGSICMMGQGIIRHNKVPTVQKPNVSSAKAKKSSARRSTQSVQRDPFASLAEPLKTQVKKLLSDMVLVEGGAYTFGGTDPGSNPAVEVTVGSFYISKYEVTEALWAAVMGSNPPDYKGPNYPVSKATYYNCLEFINKLNQLTHKNFRLPREEEWEYAALGGKYSHGYQYSGSNRPYEVGWYKDNSGNTKHEVGLLKPNELGLYDMTGNVSEWCQGFENFAPLRGGYIYDSPNERELELKIPKDKPLKIDIYNGFRLAMSAPVSHASAKHEVDPSQDTPTPPAPPQLTHDLATKLTVPVRSQIEKLLGDMVYIEGGKFVYELLNVTPEEAPGRVRVIKPFFLCKYEVTEKLWTLVMGSNPSHYKKGDDFPVENMTYDACQEFIGKLNQLTGCHFRLPTQEEWQYAARGGRHSNGYRYSGSNILSEVADCNSDSKQKVGQLKPNELGLYDMTGNVREYLEKSKGLYSNLIRIVGGYWYLKAGKYYNELWRVSLYSSYEAGMFTGLRLALDDK